MARRSSQGDCPLGVYNALRLSIPKTVRITGLTYRSDRNGWRARVTRGGASDRASGPDRDRRDAAAVGGEGRATERGD